MSNLQISLQLNTLCRAMNLKKVTYPLCDIEGHAQEPLSRLCIDEKCQNRTVVCCICEYEKHQGHQTLPIKTFLQQLAEREQEEIKVASFANKFQSIKDRFFNMIFAYRKETLDQLQALQTKGKIYFNRCEETLFDLTSLSSTKNIFSEGLDKDQAKTKSFKMYFKKILSLYGKQDKNSFSLKTKLQQFISSCKDKQKRMIQCLQIFSKQVTKSFKKSQDILAEALDTVKAKLVSLRWSQTLKGAKIKIQDVTVQQTGMESSGQRFCMMQQALPMTSKTRWGIKVKKFVGWVGLGICLKNMIKGANYHFNYTNIGHGSYLISSNGYSWSHSTKDFNSAFKTFQFTVNDIVYIEYDPKDNKLRFRKNNGAEKFQLDIALPPSGDFYHPCVNLCSTGDSVQLVYPGVPLS